MKVRHRITYAALALMLAVSSILFSVSFAGAEPQRTAGVSAAVLQDAEVYAKSEGVTVEEAIHRFHLIDVAGPLHSELLSKEAATFGDGWIENGPQFKFVLQFTENGEQAMQPYLLKYPELSPYVEIRRASITYADLTQEQAKLMSDLKKVAIDAHSEADVKTGRITIYVVDLSALKKAAEDGLLSLPSNLDIVQVASLSQLYYSIIGGHKISVSSVWATTGFGALDGSTRVITTAGHFANQTSRSNAVYRVDQYTQVNVNYRSDGYPWYDIAWYTPTGSDQVTNVIQDSPTTTRGIAWVEDYSSIWIGEYVFKYGQATGNTVGQVSNKTYSDGYYGYYVRVQTINGQPLANYGDSGAPCYRGDYAIGSLVGAPPGTNDMYFYPVSRAPTEVGISVLTSP